jgi:hypothetical protein
MAAFLAGCSGAPDMKSLTTGATAPSSLTVSTTEAYARVARGANRCWFGPKGRYRTTHVLYAEAAPAAAGGEVEIIVHERDTTSERPWGPRAFRIVMTSVAGQASVETENLRMPETEADRMRREVPIWVGDNLVCDGEKSAPATAAGPAPQAKP